VSVNVVPRPWVRRAAELVADVRPVVRRQAPRRRPGPCQAGGRIRGDQRRVLGLL